MLIGEVAERTGVPAKPLRYNEDIGLVPAPERTTSGYRDYDDGIVGRLSFKHPMLGLDDAREAWSSDPRFFPAIPPAHWLMVAEVAGQVLVVPLAPPESGRS